MLHSGIGKGYKIVALLMIICRPVFCSGQELTMTNARLIRHAKVIMLSEWHLLDILPPYKRKLIEKLYKEEGLTDLVLETGKSTAYLLNEYVATGDLSILNNFPLFTQRDKDYWKEFRQYKLLSGKPIKIHGLDFERMTIVPALKLVLEKTKNTRSELYRYLVTLPDTVLNLYKYDMMIAERSAVIQKCISIYKSDTGYYGSIYDNGYIIKEICENTAVETDWGKRWDAMAHNLRLLYNSNGHKYLLIVGMFHVDCPNPIQEELQREYRMDEKDIVNIVLVVKDCDVEAMYKGRGRVQLGSSPNILAQTSLVDSLYQFYAPPCKYNLVDIKTTFPAYTPSFKCDYILPIDCKYDTFKCD
jgi:hypothetical protein